MAINTNTTRVQDTGISIIQPNGKKYTITVGFEEITPDRAEAMLEARADHQRAIKDWSIHKLVDDMRRDNWWMTGDAITFDCNGKVVGGQHRLVAVAKSGKANMFIVVRGVAHEAYAAMDAGVGKSIGDIFKFNEIQNAHLAAATARWIYRYENQQDGILARQQIITRKQVETAYLNRADSIQEAAHENKELSAFFGSAAMVVALSIIISEAYGKEFTARFFTQLSTGITTGIVLQLYKAINVDNKRVRKMLTPDSRFASVLEAARDMYAASGRKLIKPTIQQVPTL